MSLVGVRATYGGLVDGLAGKSAVLTSGAVIASFESGDKGCKGGTASCAVEGNERPAICHCGCWWLNVAQWTWDFGGELQGPGE